MRKAKNFTDWMATVELVLWSMVGLNSRDLDDFPYYDAFEGGATPRATAKRALRNAGWGA